MTKVINLLAGPGAGKSTLAAELFAEMKWEGHSVELINEHAKEVTWEGHYNLLQDQLFITAMQNRKQQRLVGKVDWIITDSPLVISLAYIPQEYLPTFRPMVTELFNEYDNHTFFVRREKKYVGVGRSQTELEARDVDLKIWEEIVSELKLPTMIIPGIKKVGVDLIMRELGLK